MTPAVDQRGKSPPGRAIGKLIWFVVALSTVVAAAQNPAAMAARAAAADLRAQPAARRATLRYLTVNSPEEKAAIAYVLNAISRARLIASPETAQPGLLRVDLAAYANPRDPQTARELAAAWEGLVEIDPYFHLRTQVAIEPTGGTQRTSPAKPTAARLKTVTIDGGWIPSGVAAELRLATSSAGAVLRGDFFVAQAATAPHYYAFAGVPETEDRLLKRLAIDRAAVDKLAADTAANLFISGVTGKPRRVVRLPGPLGGAWFTRDIALETPDRDPLRNPINYAGPAGNQVLRYDAAEWFTAKENKFWLVAVFDAAGRRQDTVADVIAKDATAHDGIVRPLVSCIRCHELNGGRGAMQPVHDDQFPLLSGEAAVLGSYLPEVARRVAELYDPVRLDREQQRDREDYAAAVWQATGLSAAVAAEALAKVFSAFADRPVTRETVAAECGLNVEQFVMATGRTTDPVILALRAGRSVRRASYEASYPELMLLVSSPE